MVGKDVPEMSKMKLQMFLPINETNEKMHDVFLIHFAKSILILPFTVSQKIILHWL